LDALERIYDVGTQERLGRLGVRRGARALELGAGRGTTALFLLSRCGAGGEVVATDIDTRWLDEIRHPNLRVVKHDILVDDLEPLGTFDLIHTRFVVHHLGERGPDAVRRAVSLLNPGGRILVEEPIHINQSGRGHPDGTAFEQVVDRIRIFGETHGLDMTSGLQLPDLLRATGLIDVDNEIVGSVTSGGDAFRTWVVATYEASKDVIPWHEVFGVGPEQFLAMSEDPTLAHVGFLLVSAWGTKPD
jgi:SAM-dependent methyltransferase